MESRFIELPENGLEKQDLSKVLILKSKGLNNYIELPKFGEINLKILDGEIKFLSCKENIKIN